LKSPRTRSGDPSSGNEFIKVSTCQGMSLLRCQGFRK
jgi:hypothetical protein